MHLHHPALSNCKAVFTLNSKCVPARPGHALFNAPRPLLGAQSELSEWCHGRFYAEIDPTDNYAVSQIEKNVDLDARVVLRIDDDEAIELLLLDNEYADRYREYSKADQLEMLLPSLSDLQGLALADALRLLERTKPHQ